MRRRLPVLAFAALAGCATTEAARPPIAPCPEAVVEPAPAAVGALPAPVGARHLAPVSGEGPREHLDAFAGTPPPDVLDAFAGSAPPEVLDAFADRAPPEILDAFARRR